MLKCCTLFQKDELSDNEWHVSNNLGDLNDVNIFFFFSSKHEVYFSPHAAGKRKMIPDTMSSDTGGRWSSLLFRKEA